MMIFFPTLYEDELLYSALARYHKRSGNECKQDTLLDIYSSINNAASVFLPSNISRIVGNMPTNCQYTEEYIIKNHTLYPFYTVFSEEKLSKELFDLMLGIKKGNTYAKCGSISTSLKFNEYFRFCPECLKEDFERYGETYWHRIHQVPGVLICPKHKIILQNSSVKTKLFKKSDLIAAEESNCLPNLDNNNDYSKEDIDKLYHLALDINYILNNKVNKKNTDWYQSNYINYLIKEDLASINKVVNQKELYAKFKNYYGDSFLNLINYNIDCDNDNWLKRITRKGKYSDGPIENILLIRFLGIKIDEFFNNKYYYTPVKNGIAPCLNMNDNHYMEHTAKNKNLIFDCKRQTIICEFICSKCGFEYAIKGEKNTIRSLGDVFDYIKCELDLNTILKEKSLIIYYSKSDYIKSPSKHRDFENIRNKHRNTWLEYKERNPNKSKTEISKACNTAALWLLKYDSKWLNENSPQLIKPTYEFNRVDWKTRDEETLSIVKDYVDRIYKSRERPKRITLYKIAYNTGLKYLNNKVLEKLPKTSEYLSDKLESFDDIKIRRIKWSISHIIEKKDRNLSVYQVCLLAGIPQDNIFWKTKVEEEINNAIKV